MNKPLFSTVIAVYGVEDYVEAFLASIEQQTIDRELVEYIFVDDCGTDKSFDLIERWARGKSYVRLLRNTVNSGASLSRRFGYEQARGKWITTIDPDDILDCEYFENVRRFLEDSSEHNLAMLTTRVLPFKDGDPKPKDTHPLGYKYRNGDRITSLLEDANAIQLGATAFIRRDIIVEKEISFDSRIRPTFEDGAFLSSYLLEFSNPLVGLVSSALYYYRKRGAGSSLVQSGWRTVAKYDDQIRFGYLPVLEKALVENDTVPEWLQNAILYDLSWYFTEDLQMEGATAFVHQDKVIAARFRNLLAQVFSYFEPEVIEKFSIRKLPWNMKETILIHFFEERFNLGRLTCWRRSDESSAFSLVTKDNPTSSLQVFVDGEKVDPKLRVVSRYYFGVPYSYETYFQVGGRDVGVLFNGRWISEISSPEPAPLVKISDEYLVKGRKSISRGRTKFSNKLENAIEVGALATGKPRLSVAASIAGQRLNKGTKLIHSKKDAVYKKAVLKYSSLHSQRQKYRGSWLIMDRTDSANDNGEHFYRWLKREHPEQKAFFVLSRKSASFDRLEREGLKLIDYGSIENLSAYLNCDAVISSDAVAEVMYHAPRRIFGDPRKPFIFLQHGVGRYDFSSWLNPKRISLIVSSTQQEYEYFADPSSPYVFNEEQVALTGLARFDRLRDLAQQRVAPRTQAPLRITVMPTWRNEFKVLTKDVTDSETLRELLSTTDFALQWSVLLNSPQVSRLVDQGKVEVSFIAHPNFSRIFEGFGFADYVKQFKIEEIDFQKQLVNSDLYVTDYSSAAFDAAVAECDIAYFQFDKSRIFAGAHTQRPGYYDELIDGFGPGFETRERFENWFEAYLDGSYANSAVHLARRNDLLEVVDGKSCEKIFEQIEFLLQHNKVS